MDLNSNILKIQHISKDWLQLQDLVAKAHSLLVKQLLRWFLPHCYLSCKFDVKRLMYGEIETNVNGGPSRGSSSASLGAPNH